MRENQLRPVYEVDRPFIHSLTNPFSRNALERIRCYVIICAYAPVAHWDAAFRARRRILSGPMRDLLNCENFSQLARRELYRVAPVGWLCAVNAMISAFAASIERSQR